MKDLDIRRIVNVFHQQTNRWERITARTRTYEAIVLFCEGEIEYYFPDRTVTARAGDLLFLPGNLPYAGQKKSPSVTFYVVDFECRSPAEFERFGAPQAVAVPQFERVCSQFSQMLDVWELQPVQNALLLKSFLYSLLCIPFENALPPKTVTTTDRILTYITENLHDSAMTVTELCRRFYISESQLRRNLHKATGLNPNEYLLLLRLNQAKNELSYSRKTIKQIAEECGFSSPYYFTRRFTSHFGLSPTAWRKIHKE